MAKNKRKKGNRKISNLPFPTAQQKADRQQAQIDQLQDKIDGHGKNIDAICESHALQISLLSNFARHDLKNYIHSIDGIVSTYSAEDIGEEQLQSIKLNISLMRETLDNFSKLVIHSDANTCDLDELIQAIAILNRDSFAEFDIDFIIDNKINQSIVFQIPFTSMLQLLNNLIMNATKVLTSVNIDKKIVLQASKDDSSLTIRVFDNGSDMDEYARQKLFEFGFSTTGGSGIGLYHARYLCELYDGSITYQELPNENIKKCFIITLPLIKDENQ